MLLLVLFISLTYLIGTRFLTWYRLRHIPGPVTARFSDFWVLRSVARGTSYEDLGKVCKQFGPLVRVAPNYLVCGDPTEIRRIWAVRSQFDRSPWYKGFQLDPPNDCSLSMRDADIHSALRAKLAAGYSGKGIENLQSSVDIQIANFIRLIETKYLSTASSFRPVDFARKTQYLTLDIISTLAFGRTFGFVDADADLFDYVKSIEQTIPLMPVLAQIPWLIGFLQSRIMKSFMPSHKDSRGLGKVMGIAKEVVAERYGENKIQRADMLGTFVANGLTQKEAEAESLVQIIAGSDTTAAALRTTMLHIITSPLVYRRLQAEIDDAISTGKVSSPVSDAEARQLPYLQACLKEGLRIWPPITGIQPRISATDALICGLQIPKGTNVGWSTKTVMRDREVFGEDAELYSPERWIIDVKGKGDEERLQRMEKTVDLVFGSARWGCLGRGISLLELNKIFVEFLRRFDFTILDPFVPMKSANFGVSIQSELFMKITARNS